MYVYMFATVKTIYSQYANNLKWSRVFAKFRLKFRSEMQERFSKLYFSIFFSFLISLKVLVLETHIYVFMHIE